MVSVVPVASVVSMVLVVSVVSVVDMVSVVVFCQLKFHLVRRAAVSVAVPGYRLTGRGHAQQSRDRQD